MRLKQRASERERWGFKPERKLRNMFEMIYFPSKLGLTLFYTFVNTKQTIDGKPHVKICIVSRSLLAPVFQVIQAISQDFHIIFGGSGLQSIWVSLAMLW